MPYLLSVITCLFLSISLLGQEWRQARNKDGIQVYTRAAAGSQFKEFRGVTELQTPISAIVAALQDVGSYPEWMPHSAASEVVARQGDTELVYRLITDAPWPVQDRDGIYRMRFERPPGSRGVRIQLSALPGRLPEDPDYVRIQRLDGYWQLSPQADGVVRVVYQVLTDPAGKVPVWLVNSTVVNQPFKTLSALRRRVALPQYQNREYSFLD